VDQTFRRHRDRTKTGRHQRGHSTASRVRGPSPAPHLREAARRGTQRTVRRPARVHSVAARTTITPCARPVGCHLRRYFSRVVRLGPAHDPLRTLEQERQKRLGGHAPGCRWSIERLAAASTSSASAAPRSSHRRIARRVDRERDGSRFRCPEARTAPDPGSSFRDHRRAPPPPADTLRRVCGRIAGTAWTPPAPAPTSSAPRSPSPTAPSSPSRRSHPSGLS
jgi:hypothetical protein